jgi:hypothetical protein
VNRGGGQWTLRDSPGLPGLELQAAQRDFHDASLPIRQISCRGFYLPSFYEPLIDEDSHEGKILGASGAELRNRQIRLMEADACHKTSVGVSDSDPGERRRLPSKREVPSEPQAPLETLEETLSILDACLY